MYHTHDMQIDQPPVVHCQHIRQIMPGVAVCCVVALLGTFCICKFVDFKLRGLQEGGRSLNTFDDVLNAISVHRMAESKTVTGWGWRSPFNYMSVSI